MAWRPNEQLIEGLLDNTEPGKITGWMQFAGMMEKMVFDLKGDFHRDIRGAKVRLVGDGKSADPVEAAKYLEGLSTSQKGNAGDMTSCLPPYDYIKGAAYFEWYSDTNGRVVLELETDQVELLTSPIPACESNPIDRKQQAENMASFLCNMAQEIGIPENRAIAIGQTTAVESAKKVISNNRIRGMKLLPKEIRETLKA